MPGLKRRIGVVWWPRVQRRGSQTDAHLLERMDQVEAAQARAIAEALAQSETLEPFVVCPSASAMGRWLETGGLQGQGFSGAADVISWYRTWRRMVGLPCRLVIAIGPGALFPAARLQRFCGKSGCELAGAFFLLPCGISGRAAKIVSGMSHIFCGAQFIREELEKIIADPERAARLLICPPGVPICPAGGNMNRQFVFGMGQSMEPESGALLVTRAMAALWQKKDLAPWEVRMFGSGSRYAEILAEAQSLGVISRLSILGDQDLAVAAQGCDVWLAPGNSLTELPDTLWAGVACDVPTIASSSPLHLARLGGAAGHGVFLAGGRNPQELAGAMIEVMTDQALYLKMKAQAREQKPGISLEAMARRICLQLELWLNQEIN